MARPSVVPEIRSALEPWLEARMAEWEAQGADFRRPTLPSTDDGKVNVRAVTLALGLRQSQEQHFYRHEELSSVVNAAAEAQGLRPIGSRAQMDRDDRVVADRIGRMRGENGDLAVALAEREAVIERQRREIEALREQLGLLEETGMVLRRDGVP